MILSLLLAALSAASAVGGVEACSEPFYSNFLSVCQGTYPAGGDCGTDSSFFAGFNCSVHWTTLREFNAKCTFAHGSCTFSVEPAGDVNRCTESCIHSGPVVAAAVGSGFLVVGALVIALYATHCCWRPRPPQGRELTTQDGSPLHAPLFLEDGAPS
jgi:hypothetical protein